MSRLTNERHESWHRDLQPLDLITARCEEAHEEIAEICCGRKRWTMHIPPEEDDSDIVFGDIISQTLLLVTYVKELEDRIAAGSTAQGQER